MTDWTDLEPRLAPERSAQLRAGLLTEITRTPARSRRRFTGIAITAAATLTVWSWSDARMSSDSSPPSPPIRPRLRTAAILMSGFSSGNFSGLDP